MRLSDLRTTILARLATTPQAGSPVGSWAHAGLIYDLFPMSMSRDSLHLTYAVGILDTTPVTQGRQRQTEGMPATTRIGVRWAYRIRKDTQSSDYNTALLAEQILVSHLLGVERTDGVASLYVEAMTRIVIDDGVTWFGEITLRALHLYDLI